MPDDRVALPAETEWYRSGVRFGERISSGSAAASLREIWREIARFGLFSMPVPSALDGLGATPSQMFDILSGLGEGCSDDGLFLAIGAHLWAVLKPLVMFGSEEQLTRYLPRLVDGTWIGAHAATEPDGGSDVMSLRTRYELREDGIHLWGTKAFVTNAPVADLLVVLATRDPALGPQGSSAFLVERSDPGVVCGRNLPKMGLETSQLSEVAFLKDACVLPFDRQLGCEGEGPRIFEAAMRWERTLILAPQVGAMRRLLNQAVSYARMRRIGGRPIAKRQMVASRIVDMYVRFMETRALARDCAAVVVDLGPVSSAASLAKLVISENSVRQHSDLLRIHGGAGYLAETGVESGLSGAFGSLLFSGTSEIQRVLIAHSLGL